MARRRAVDRRTCADRRPAIERRRRPRQRDAGIAGRRRDEVGADGTVRGTALTTVLIGPQPAALWARMRNEYLVPLVSEPTV